MSENKHGSKSSSNKYKLQTFFAIEIRFDNIKNTQSVECSVGKGETTQFCVARKKNEEQQQTNGFREFTAIRVYLCSRKCSRKRGKNRCPIPAAPVSLCRRSRHPISDAKHSRGREHHHKSGCVLNTTINIGSRLSRALFLSSHQSIPTGPRLF